ncbi:MULTISPECIES: CBS domain-containing protein [Vibrio]|jgi:predicted transcriptional regulator|uniref:CBS domain protein n=1 Tax=Vibrio diazotrophicus TaxID=685 RepID=A0A2J8I6C4_VIBDI|nr:MULTISPECIES: CBS domain-containing protein [Vibrio]MCF7362560.1 CBS domain-containing protein [Vibrio sp. A1-b2]MCZ4373538.1 CBS domain-containing protein [Vibrio diazotrophicus]PNH81094.1 CBS domain-containing protein [Vibrio diazotrophicus]PNH92997.1 CBS domain-containing protein [Vibrio diazotrophicus]PNH98225.1 CBS domain-containing protein [Vibrio diazotrophicus]
MNREDKVRVRDVMAGTYVMVDGLTTVFEGICLAKKHQVKALIVDKRHEDDEYGIVLMNDIAKKVLAKNRSPKRTNIYEIMTKPALSVSPDMNVKYCARLFERFGISRAPVIDGGRIIGMVSYNNIVVNGMVRDDD